MSIPEPSVRSALLRVAENVAKHLIQRSGWTADDECFQIDLRESEREIEAIISARALAAERERDAAKAELSAREHEVSVMRDSLRKVEHERELLDRYGRELDEIGRVMGCDHKDDGYMRCVTSQLAEMDALRARLAEVEGERDQWKAKYDDVTADPGGYLAVGWFVTRMQAAEADAGRLAELLKRWRPFVAVSLGHAEAQVAVKLAAEIDAALAAHAGTESS